MESKINQTRKLENTQAQNSDFFVRKFSYVKSTIDEKNRSIEAVMSTEKPVTRYSWWDGDYDEILQVNGAVYSDNIPLLDSHNRWSTEDLFGSVREIRVEKEQLIGRTFFAEDKRSISAWKKVKGGHLNDVSIGYRIEEYTVIEKGETRNVGGKDYTAKDRAIRVVTRYTIKELSFCAIGANDECKTRSEKKGEIKIVSAATENKKEDVRSGLDTEKIDTSEIERRTKEEIQKRTSDVVEFGRKFDYDVSDHLIRGESLQQVKDSYLEKRHHERTENPTSPNPNVGVGETRQEKTAKYVDNCLALRFGIQSPHEKVESQSRSLLQLGEDILNAHGIDTRGMSKGQIAQKLMTRGLGATGDFPNILANTIGQSIQKEYNECENTWKIWCGQESVSDFKERKHVQLGESSGLEIIPEGKDYPSKKVLEKGEPYSIDKHGLMFLLTWEAIINDDLNAFVRISRQLGRASMRTIDTSVYSALNANAALSDTIALFHADHNNLAGTGGAITVDSLGAGRLAMRTQKGLTNSTSGIICATPKFLIVPEAAWVTANTVVGSVFNPDNANNSKNVFHDKLQVVSSPRLDLSSSKAWYLAADQRDMDTIIVVFLEGYETPAVEEEDNFDNDTRKYKIKQPFGILVADHRGLYKNAGA